LSSTPRKPGIPKRSIINRDDPNYSFYAAFPADEVISYGLHETAQVRATGIHYAPDGTQFEVDGQKLALLLVGEFNVYNALAALAVARSAGYADFAPAGLRAIPGVAGRMERLYAGQNFTAIVDFAHTPNALEKALTAGRRMLAPGQRLIAVFGSAGLRDVAKRRLMAEVSARLADLTILTAEDPRTESLDEILAMMARGCEAQGGIEGETFLRVPDRGAALYRACQLARPGDLVMACGKGHEQSMCFGVVEYPWDDRTALLAALRGAPLRTLPTAAAE
jgi:UDP-N-acetylmuramoyl-L-alanyl-D-glutamate--2,6-diaminopimelate ligase